MRKQGTGLIKVPSKKYLRGVGRLKVVPKLAFASIVLVLIGVFLSTGGPGVTDVALAHTPACPSSVPTTNGEFFWTDSNGDRWFVIRQSESSGYTTVQAYVASEDYDGGYVPSSPHETCVLKVRGADDDEDLDPPVQIFFPNDDDDEEEESEATRTGTTTGTNTPGNTQQPSATFTLAPGTQNSDTPTLATVGFATFAYFGTPVIIVVAFSNLGPDSNSQTTEYYYRIRVVQGQTVNLLCQGAGMNTIRQLNTNTGSSIQTATIPGTCPVGTYVIEVELASSDDATISDPIAEGTSYLVIGPVSGSQNTGQTGGSSGSQGGTQNGQKDGGNQGGGNSGITIIRRGPGQGHSQGGSGQGNNGQGNNGQGNNGQGNNGQGNNGQGNNGQGGGQGSDNQCGTAARGSSGTPNRPEAPTLILTQDTSQVGVQWVAPNDNGSPIHSYSILVVPEGGTRRVIDAGGLSEVVGNLDADTEHEIRVSACNSVGPSNWSQGATIQTVSTHGTNGGNTIGTTNNAWCGVALAGSIGTPDAPNPPTVTAGGEDSLNVSWTAPSSDGGSVIKMYAILHTPPGGMDGTVKVMSGTSETLTGLDADTNYEVQVAACNAVGMSDWSAAATGRTDPESSQSTENAQPPGVNGNGENGANGNSGGNGNSNSNSGGSGNSDNGNHYEIVVLERCSSGMWAGHTHTNTINYWGGTDCLEKSLIDDINPAPRNRMWTKDRMDDHEHEGFSDADYTLGDEPGNSCNSKHVAAHTSHNILTGCGP